MPFVAAEETLADRLVVNIWGQEKRGKTSLAMTFPSPRYYFNFDFRYEELLRQHPEWRQGLQISSHIVPPELELEEAERIFRAVVADFEDAINSASGTVIVDTATQLWELVSFTKVGAVQAKRIKMAEKKAARAGKEFDPDDVLSQRFDWGPANNAMGAILRSVKLNPNMNAAYINRGREVFDDRGNATGEFQFHGFKGTPAIVDINLEMTMQGRGKNAQMVAKVGSNGYRPDLEGQAIPDLTYADLKELFLEAT